MKHKNRLIKIQIVFINIYIFLIFIDDRINIL